jgi:hypothetical protein
MLKQEKKLAFADNHRAMNDFQELFEFILPVRENGLNLDDSDLYQLKLYLTCYCLIQFTCCLTLLILNNWHYILEFYDAYSVRKRDGQLTRKLKKTLSVIEFLNKYENNENIHEGLFTETRL